MDHTLRVIDANINRAREGLRVLEDLARFELDDAELAASAKSIRHALRTTAEMLPFSRSELLDARDTTGDVGVRITGEREADRANEAQIAAAAAGRVTEALRVLEETSKRLSEQAAGHFKSLRYRTYTLERDLDARLGRRAPQWPLCVLLSEDLCPGKDWLRVARGVLDAGVPCIQLREKHLESRELLARAKALVGLARPRGAAVIINDRPDIARLAGADGVHVGQHDLSVADARAIVGSRRLVGVSTANLDQARAARRDGADYVGLGPVFASNTKAKPSLAGLEYVRSYLSDPDLAKMPYLVISGITPENVAEVVGAGGRGVAVSSAVCSCEDPGEACRKFMAALPPPPKPSTAPLPKG